ncbi:hypothetical protein Tco_0872535 [Tanacetum coccineum]
MPPVLQRSKTNLGLYTKISGKKKAQKILRNGIANAGNSRVPPYSVNKTDNIQDPMIKRDQWPRLEAAKERVKDLEASSPCLTGLHLSLTRIF